MDYSNIACDSHWLHHCTEVLRICGGPLLLRPTALYECSFIKKKKNNFYLQLDVYWRACEPPTMTSTMLQWPTMPTTTTTQTFCLVFSNPETAPAEGESPYPWFVLGRNTSTNPEMQRGSRENVISSRKLTNIRIWSMFVICGVYWIT